MYTIRGVKVMLDANLAEIYGYSTKDFNRQVKNAFCAVLIRQAFRLCSKIF
nr:ORF6N domain-containing protein [Fibrobacter sp.]